MASQMNDPRHSRLVKEFALMRRLLVEHPHRIFDVKCAALTNNESYDISQRAITLDHLHSSLSAFLDPETFSAQYPELAPAKYLIEYRCASVLQQAKGQHDIALRDPCNARVLIIYTLNWPTEPPTLVFLGNPPEWGEQEVWHPNIKGTHICLENDRPFPVSTLLAEIVRVIGQMLQFQSFNLESVLNSAAAAWTVALDEQGQLPIDSRNLLNRQDMVERRSDVRRRVAPAEIEFLDG